MLLYLHYNGQVCIGSFGLRGFFRGGQSEGGWFVFVDNLFALKNAATAVVSKLTESRLKLDRLTDSYRDGKHCTFSPNVFAALVHFRG